MANLVPLAGGGTTLCHGAIQYSQRTYDAARCVYVEPEAVAVGIRLNMYRDQIEYVTRTKGEWWLEKHYPQKM